MKNLNFLTIAIVMVISAGVFFMIGQQVIKKSDSEALNQDQMNAYIREYLLSNPEIIPEAVEVLRSRQNVSALMESEELLYNDGFSHVAGNVDGDITIVEFYDYNCGYCKQVPEHIAQLMEEDKNVRVIFKELPILAESSQYASVAAMASIKQDKFMDFHSALMKNKRQSTEVNTALKVWTVLFYWYASWLQ